MNKLFSYTALYLLFFSFLVLLFYNPLPAFSVFNKKWDGCSDFAEFIKGKGWRLETIYSPLTLNLTNPHGKLLIFLSPAEKLSDLEVDAVQEFVYNGGGLLLADDFREGNSLSRVFGVEFRRNLLLEPSLYSKQPVFPLVNLTVKKGFKKVFTLVLNHPSALVFKGKLKNGKYYVKLNGTWLKVNLSIQAESSGSSWLDVNYNLERDEDEPRGPFPVVVFMSYGEGKAVIVSDPDIFINDMLFKGSNLAAANYMLNYLAPEKEVTVYVCESKVWLFKPLSIYFLTFLIEWSQQPLIFRFSVSFLFSIVFFSFLILLTVKSVGSHLSKSPLNFLSVKGGGGEGKGSELVSEFKSSENDYNKYLTSFFEWFLERVGVNPKISVPKLIYEEIVEKYPSVKSEELKKLLESCLMVKKGSKKVVGFKDFINMCDSLMEVLEKIGA